MPPKSLINEKSSTSFELEEVCTISLSLYLHGDSPEPGDWMILVLFNGQIILEGKWLHENKLETDTLPLNLKDTSFQDLVADKPLIFIVRIAGGKGTKEPDPLLNTDNRLVGTLDLLPLLLGEQNIYVKVPLVFINSGNNSACSVEVRAATKETCEITRTPLLITMVSAHCLPYTKEGTVYLAAIGLDGVLERMSVNFGMSLSFPDAEKIVWASPSNVGLNTAFNVPNEDVFIPNDLIPENDGKCCSVYWNAMKRVLIDPKKFRDRLLSTFLLEVAGVPKAGKIDIRGRFMAFVDAGVLVEAGQYSISICSKLLIYNDAERPEGVGGLLELPPTSAKPSARDSNLVMDEYGHTGFVVIKFDLLEPLASQTKISSLFETIGFSPREGQTALVDEFEIETVPVDTILDVRRIRQEGGALAVHKELSGLACRGLVPMTQGIKRTAANRLLMRVRTMLKQFSPGNCSLIDWQDLVTAQHCASRRAVTSSFTPQFPQLRLPLHAVTASCCIDGNSTISGEHNLNINTNHPRALFLKALRCLEGRKDIDAKNYLLEALSVQVRNKFLLWTYGGQEFDRGIEGAEAATAAFRIAVKGDYSDGTTNAIGWAALHALYHHLGNPYAAFVAGMKMRKAYELPRDWKKFFQRWTDISGTEELLWIPTSIASDNPMLITAAFFLCLKCYKFSDKVLYCYKQECATRESRNREKTKLNSDYFYVKASSLLLRCKFDEALRITVEGVKLFGPSPIMSQMRTSCLMCIHGWNEQCEVALSEAERSGSEECPAILLQAAINGLDTNPNVSLQRAARAHNSKPCAYSAYTIGRIYHKIGENSIAERWAAAAVKFEPSLADGWAFLSLLAVYDRNLDKARAMLRTAKQCGLISEDIYEEVKNLSVLVELETLPDSLVKNVCLCDYV